MFRKNLPERYVVPRGRQRPGENHALAGERPGLEPALPLTQPREKEMGVDRGAPAFGCSGWEV